MPTPATIDVLGTATPALTATDVLEGMVRAARRQMAAEPSRYPHIARAGVRYRVERRLPGGARREEWLLPAQLLLRGIGDCEDLAIYMAAWWRLRGVHASAVVVPAEGGDGYHAIVRFADGRDYDPTLELIELERKGVSSMYDDYEDDYEGDYEEDMPPPPAATAPPGVAVSPPRLTMEADGTAALELPDVQLPGGRRIRGARFRGRPEEVAAAATKLIDNPAVAAVVPPTYRTAAKAAVKIARVGLKHGPRAARLVLKHGPKILKRFGRWFS